MVTVADVAREAGVSAGTVSNVLNNKPTVKNSTRIKVENAMAKLDYHMNYAAKMLRSNQSSYIGLIVPSIANPFFSEFARSVEKAAHDAGYSIFLCNDERNYVNELNYVYNLLGKGVSGIIIAKPQLSVNEISNIFTKCPIVITDFDRPKDTLFSSVNVDFKQGFQQALDLLVSYGHNRIAFIDGLRENNRTKALFPFLKESLKEKGLDIPTEYYRKGNYGWESGYLECGSLLRMEFPPTAILCANDFMALGAMKAAIEKGLKVPSDISIVGYDNISLSKIFIPSLTTINNPITEVGSQAVRLLLAEIERRREGRSAEEGATIVLSSELVVRDSVGRI